MQDKVADKEKIIMINVHRVAALLNQLGVASLYALIGLLVLACCSRNGIVTVIWLPAGLALSVLSMAGNKYAWAIFVGAMVVNVITTDAFWVAAVIASGNTLEAFFGAWLLKATTF
jgi:MASE1.